MKRSLMTLTCCSLLALPFSAFSAEHAAHSMDTGSHTAMKMMNGDSIMLGEQSVDGVKAMAHLNDVGEVMAKMGKKENYHFMVMFSDAQTGAALDQGTVAVKITDPATGQGGAAIPLMGMGGHFGADVALSAKGEYHFMVGSKLADGKKRQYSFRYTVK
ncbi:MAG: hypothetical protein AB7U29_00905 [Desulfobulbus sp.]